jgi:poly(A) polymerase
MHTPESETETEARPPESETPAQAEARRARLRARREARKAGLESERPASNGEVRRAPAREVTREERRAARARREPILPSAPENGVKPSGPWPWEKSGGPAPLVHAVRLDPARVDEAARRVVTKLTRAGHEAYLVGGCVRDLLVGKSPKDFDVATSALPEEVRSVFRNSRIIGRRFRLVHVFFGGGQIIETATFRRTPQPTESDEEDSLLIRSDNVFGEAHEDALRRDFTINALFYDIERESVLDWTNGMRDIESRTVRTIGDPMVRLQEDPVRILRAVKFAARLDFGLDPALYDAAVHCRGALAMAARPRLSEEILRLMRGGASHRSFWLALEMGLLDVLLPELAAFVVDAKHGAFVFHLLSEVDERTKETGAPLDDVLLWAALLFEPLLEACAHETDRMRAALEFMEPVVERIALPRRIADGVARLAATFPRHQAGKASRFKKSPLYPLLVELTELRKRALARARA